MIEALAKLYAETGGTAGLIVFGFFAVIITAMLSVLYVALQILASFQDYKSAKWQAGKLVERRHPGRPQKYSPFMKLVRKLRGVSSDSQ